MRPLETLLVSLLLSGAFAFLIFRPGAWWPRLVWFVLAFLTLGLHVVFEGAHWQMIPAYGAVAAIMPFVFRTRTGYSTAMLAAVACLSMFSCALSWVLPMFRLPAPTGRFPIGTRILHLVDGSRMEEANSRGGHREVVVQLWYPAAPSRSPRAKYRCFAETTWLSSYQSALPTNAQASGPVLRDGPAFPVVVFSPAWNGRRTQDTFLAEDLASHGYVVAAVDHPYNSGPISFPDGRVLPPGHADIGDLYNDPPEQLRAKGQHAVTKESADLTFVLDQLTAMALDPSSPFQGRLDTARVGVLGHSFGAARGAVASKHDSRIRAVADLDGWLWGDAIPDGLTKPLMVIQEDPDPVLPNHKPTSYDILDAENEEALRRTFKTAGGYRIILHGSSHTDFTDRPLFSPLRRFSGNGTIHPRRAHEIIRAYVLAFFDRFLRNQGSPLLETKSPYPEADARRFPIPTDTKASDSNSQFR